MCDATNTLCIISDFDKNYSAYYWQFLRKILCVLLVIFKKNTLRTIDFTEQTKPVNSVSCEQRPVTLPPLTFFTLR